jgi:hypothetical protein
MAYTDMIMKHIIPSEGKRDNCTLYSIASNPLHMNSNKVFTFSGLGAVINIFEYL